MQQSKTKECKHYMFHFFLLYKHYTPTLFPSEDVKFGQDVITGRDVTWAPLFTLFNDTENMTLTPLEQDKRHGRFVCA